MFCSNLLFISYWKCWIYQSGYCLMILLTYCKIGSVIINNLHIISFLVLIQKLEITDRFECSGFGTQEWKNIVCHRTLRSPSLVAWKIEGVVMYSQTSFSQSGGDMEEAESDLLLSLVNQCCFCCSYGTMWWRTSQQGVVLWKTWKWSASSYDALPATKSHCFLNTLNALCVKC